MARIYDSKIFFELQKKMDKVPFTQSIGWHNYLSSQSKELCYFVDDETHPSIALWGKLLSVPFFKQKIMLIDGESMSNSLNEKLITSFYIELIDNDIVGLSINSNNQYKVDFEIGLRRAGFVRPLGHFYCPLTIELDIEAPFSFNRNWKRNVKKGIQAGLRFEEIVEVKQNNIRDFVNMFNEMSKLKKLSYNLDENEIKALVNSNDMRLFVVLNANEIPIAGRIIHCYKNYASDVYAANSTQARECGASYFLMQNIFEVIKKEGFGFFDFGRIPPSNHSTDSVYVFKNASRGRKIQYNGEWVYYKNKMIEFMLLAYKLKQKKQRY